MTIYTLGRNKVAVVIYGKSRILWTVIGIVAIITVNFTGKINTRTSRVKSPFSDSKQIEMRAVWIQGTSITTRQKIDQALERAEAGKFNAIFIGVFADGQTLFPSKLAPEHNEIPAGFDPLAYLLTEAHRRNIEVHAWFVVGRVGNQSESPILTKHPDWMLVGPDGSATNWLNFNREDVREFIFELVKEVLTNYQVDGIHLDYLQFPGPQWGFDDYSNAIFSKEYGYGLKELNYTNLPAYGKFESNPLNAPSTAQVLAKFTNGVPAVAINHVGAGQVILINWSAQNRNNRIASVILQRGIQFLLKPGGEVYLLNSETNVKKYGYRGYYSTFAWLGDLGITPGEIQETSIDQLSPGSVLILPGVYLISDNTAAQLLSYVNRGGEIIFIDGPTLSMDLVDIQRLTGMTGRSPYFNDYELLVAVGEHPLIPNSSRKADLIIYQTKDQQWKDFRRANINILLQQIYQFTKANSPSVLVSVAVADDQNTALNEDLQDWPDWLKSPSVDFIVPLAYVEDTQQLQDVMNAWLPFIDENDQIVFGLISHIENHNNKILKSPDQLLSELKMERATGSNGVIIFDLDTINHEQLKALGSYPSSYSPPSSSGG